MNYRVTINQRTFNVHIPDLHSRPIIAIVDGVPIEVMPENGAQPVQASLEKKANEKQPGIPSNPGSLSNGRNSGAQVLAPIPGVILSLAVEAGSEVVLGQELCLLEAMKMKNTLRAGRAGKIARILVSTGQTVKHGDVLMEFEA